MANKEIVFVTTNKGKVASAQRFFEDKKVEFKTYNHELIEPRTEDIQEIARFKVHQAYEIVKNPCIALDSGFFIDELKGFPKTYVNHTLDTIGIKGILKLMKDIDNRKCSFKEVLAYYDGKEVKYFLSEHKGKLSNEVKGVYNENKWSDLWYIFIPEGSDKTLAEFSDLEQKNRTKKSVSSIKKFADWYE